MSYRVIVRGFSNGHLVFIDQRHEEPTAGEAEKHLRLLSAMGPFFMLECEFPDMPYSERFLRFGTDTRHMREPIELTDANGFPLGDKLG